MNTEAPTTRASRVQTLQYKGRTFVTGLRWHPLGSITGHMKEARQFGKEHQLDIVTIRRTPRIIQAGFVSRSDGVTKGMYSLASTLAGQLGESWIAAWKVSQDEDSYAVVAVHKGGIIPGCDLISTAAEVRKRVAQQRSRGIEFEQWYLPPEFEMGGQPLDIEEFLVPSRLKREYRLRPLVFGLSRAELVQLALLAMLVAGGVIGYTQWKSYVESEELKKRIAAEQARLDALARMEAESGSAQPVQALEHPWANQPSVLSFLEGCSSIIYHLPLRIHGWYFSDVQCNGKQVVATYKRSGNSTSAELLTAIGERFSTRPAFFEQGNATALRYDISLPVAGDEPLQDSPQVLSELSSWLHGFSQDPTLNEVPVVVPQEPALPGQPAPPPPPPPQWKHFEIRYTTGVPPYDSIGSAPISVLRLREIKAELQTTHLMWTVTGDLYAK